MGITSNGLVQLGFKAADVDFVLQDNTDGEGVFIAEWNSASPQPSVAEIEAADAEWQAAYDSQSYARNRKAEYDQLVQFEMIFDDQRDGTTTWVDKINEIKGRHPK
jgi:hypothetical protein